MKVLKLPASSPVQRGCLRPGLVWVELRLRPSLPLSSLWLGCSWPGASHSAQLGRRARITFRAFTSSCSSQAAELPTWGSCTRTKKSKAAKLTRSIFRYHRNAARRLLSPGVGHLSTSSVPALRQSLELGLQGGKLLPSVCLTLLLKPHHPRGSPGIPCTRNSPSQPPTAPPCLRASSVPPQPSVVASSTAHAPWCARPGAASLNPGVWRHRGRKGGLERSCQASPLHFHSLCSYHYSPCFSNHLSRRTSLYCFLNFNSVTESDPFIKDNKNESLEKLKHTHKI